MDVPHHRRPQSKLSALLKLEAISLQLLMFPQQKLYVCTLYFTMGEVFNTKKKNKRYLPSLQSTAGSSYFTIKRIAPKFMCHTCKLNL
jgi:hypothetical protein